MHMRMHLGEIDRHGRLDAERATGPRQMRAPGGGEQRFGGDAAGIQAVAAHPVLLDQHHR